MEQVSESSKPAWNSTAGSRCTRSAAGWSDQLSLCHHRHLLSVNTRSMRRTCVFRLPILYKKTKHDNRQKIDKI